MYFDLDFGHVYALMRRLCVKIEIIVCEKVRGGNYIIFCVMRKETWLFQRQTPAIRLTQVKLYFADGKVIAEKIYWRRIVFRLQKILK